jgi:hypothetical protein
VPDQSTLTHCGPYHSLLRRAGLNMKAPALYGPTVAKSIRQQAKSNDVACSGKVFERFLKSRSKFDFVGQNTTSAGPQYTDTPRTLQLIAAHVNSALYGVRAAKSVKSTRKPAKSNDVACSDGDFGRLLGKGRSSVPLAKVHRVLRQSTLTHRGSCHSLLQVDGSNMACLAFYGPTAAKSAKFTRQPAKSNEVACSGEDSGRLFKSRPTFSSVCQSTPGTETKYTNTPWTFPLGAAHRRLEHGMPRALRAQGREIGCVHSQNPRNRTTLLVRAVISDDLLEGGKSSV